MTSNRKAILLTRATRSNPKQNKAKETTGMQQTPTTNRKSITTPKPASPARKAISDPPLEGTTASSQQTEPPDGRNKITRLGLPSKQKKS
ncbi:hypothetical protein Ancab_028779 [Ancistrocladus abbreviatus]